MRRIGPSGAHRRSTLQQALITGPPLLPPPEQRDFSAGAGDPRWRRGSPARFDDDRGPGQAQSFTADSVAGEGDPSTDSIRALNSASERSFVQ